MRKRLAVTSDSNLLQAIALKVLGYTEVTLAENGDSKKICINKNLSPRGRWGGYELPLTKEYKKLEVFEQCDLLNIYNDSILDDIVDDLIYDCRKKDCIEFNIVLLSRGFKCRKPSVLIFWRR